MVHRVCEIFCTFNGHGLHNVEGCNPIGLPHSLCTGFQSENKPLNIVKEYILAFQSHEFSEISRINKRCLYETKLIK